MAGGFEDLPLAYTAEEWAKLPQSTQALHSGMARPLKGEAGSEETFGAMRRTEEGEEIKYGKPYWEQTLIDLGMGTVDVPEGMFAGGLTQIPPSPVGAYMRKVLEGYNKKPGSMQMTPPLKEDPKLWHAVEEFLQGKDHRGVVNRVKRLPQLQAPLFHEMDLLRQEEARQGRPATRKGKEAAFRRALSAAHQVYESGHEQLTTAQSGAEGFWSVRRLLSKGGREMALTKEVGDYNPPPRYGVEFPAHPLMTVLQEGGIDEHFGRVTGGKEAVRGSTTEAHLDFMLAYRKEVFGKMGKSPTGLSVVGVMEEAERGNLHGVPAWEALGYESNDKFLEAAREAGTQVTATFVMVQSDQALKSAGNFNQEARAVHGELMVLQRQVQKGRYEEINQAMQMQGGRPGGDYWRLTQAMGQDWNGAIDFNKMMQAAMKDAKQLGTAENAAKVLKEFQKGKKGPAAILLEDAMVLQIRGRLIRGEFTVEEAVDIWTRAVSGKVKIGNQTVTVNDEINKFALPISGAQLLGYGAMMAYRGAMENPKMMQMLIRDYDESNPEDAAKQATLGHRLIEASRQAAVSAIQKMKTGFGNARAGGKVDNAISWSSLPAIFMSEYMSNELGYANTLMRHWYEEDTDFYGNRVDTLRTKGPLESLVPLPDIIPQYAPQRPGAYIEPKSR